VEVINDIDDGLVTFFRVLRENRKELVRRLKLTPYARVEREQCHAKCDEPCADDVEKARRYYTAVCQSYSGTTTSFSRSNSRPQAVYWRDRIDRIDEVAERLRAVVLESMDAARCIEKYDDPKTCFYVYPPYPHGSRTVASQKKYRHEMTDKQHLELLDALNNVDGKVLLSGYECDLYARPLKRWWVRWRHRVACSSATTLNQRNVHHRVEVLWANF
jgi:DNA adenine methylase